MILQLGAPVFCVNVADALCQKLTSRVLLSLFVNRCVKKKKKQKMLYNIPLITTLPLAAADACLPSRGPSLRHNFCWQSTWRLLGITWCFNSILNGP